MKTTNVKFYMATYEPCEADEQPTKEVLAVFVDTKQEIVYNGKDNNGFDCYTHLGQHSVCSESFLRENCREATKQEYQDLYNELTNLVGYNLNVL